jgi:hypothetical protein
MYTANEMQQSGHFIFKAITTTHRFAFPYSPPPCWSKHVEDPTQSGGGQGHAVRSNEQSPIIAARVEFLAEDNQTARADGREKDDKPLG